MRPTIALYGGGFFHIDRPYASTFGITDIAQALSKLCRFTGHCRKFYSVAEHSVLASHIVPEEMMLSALMHDAAEAIIGDMSSPLKHMLPDYKKVEASVEAEIFYRFGIEEYLVPKMHPAIKHADLVMLATERRDLLPPCQELGEWACLEGITPLECGIDGWIPERAFQLFMNRYHVLTRLT